MAKIRLTPSIIPNLFTSMNMFSGLLSIISAASGEFHLACWFIISAAIFDTLDGAMARLTKSCSDIGVQLDSLSDVISFGTAPAFLIYSIYYKAHSVDPIGLIISSLLMIAGGFRLARFNVQLVGFEKSYFKGLPIPSSALTLVLFIFAFYKGEAEKFGVLNVFIVPLILILSYLMVSNIKYDTLPAISLAGIKEKPFFAINLLLSLAIGIFMQSVFAGAFFYFIFLITFGIIRYILSFFTKNKKSKR